MGLCPTFGTVGHGLGLASPPSTVASQVPSAAKRWSVGSTAIGLYSPDLSEPATGALEDLHAIVLTVADDPCCPRSGRTNPSRRGRIG
jgi:hypothetical protein